QPIIAGPAFPAPRTASRTMRSRPHLHHQHPLLPLSPPAHPLVHKILVLLHLIQNTLDPHPVSPCARDLCWSTYPLTGSGQDALPLSLYRALPTNSTEEPFFSMTPATEDRLTVLISTI